MIESLFLIIFLLITIIYLYNTHETELNHKYINNVDIENNAYFFENLNSYFNTINATYNMIPKLDDIITDYEGNSFFHNNDVKRPKLDSNMMFFSMNSDLKELGENKDITLVEFKEI